MSNLRLRDSTNTYQRLIDYAIELGHKVVAITEHESVSNAIKVEKYYKKVKEKNPDFKVILGNEIYLCRDGLDSSNFVKGEDYYYHFILLAKDAIGHQQIRELSTRAWLRSYSQNNMTRVPTYYQDLTEVIKENPGHVIGSSACLGGFIARKIMQYKETNDLSMREKIKHWCRLMQDIFGKEDFYLEMQPSNTNEQILVNKELLELSKELGIPYIITLDAHYLKKTDRNIHKAFLNAQEGDREVDAFYASTYMMDTQEVESYFPYFEKELLYQAYENINIIISKCEDYSLLKPLKIPSLPWRKPVGTEVNKKYVENIPTIKKFIESDFDGDNILAQMISDKLDSDERLQTETSYKELEDNLQATWVSSEVNQAHWSAYFLNLQKNIDVCWEAGTLVGPGRGCFIPGSKVTMSDGTTKNIENVKIGDLVYTHLGRVRPVINTFTYTVNEPLYKISIQGTEDITCTNNHKFWAIPNHRCKYKDNCTFSCKRKCNEKDLYLKPRWVEAKDLQINDMVAIPKYQYSEKKIEYLDLNNYSELINYHTVSDNEICTYFGNNTMNIRNKYQRFIPIDSNFLYFLGVFIGDGWVRNKDNYSEIGIAFNSVTIKDQTSQKRVEKYLSSLNIQYKIVIGQNDKKVNQLIFHNPFLGNYLKQSCGDGAENKHIPSEMLYNNREEMESLLYGLLNSDGCILETENRICYDTINYNLAVQVRNLLSYLGLYASTKIREAHGNCKTSYKVSSGGKQLELLSFLNFKGQRNVTQRDNKYFYPRIETIKVIEYNGNVYDFSVEEDTSYIINNIAVHNSGVGFYLLYILDCIQINCLWEKTRTFGWRFLNPERVSVLDVDTDIEGGRRPLVLQALRDYYGQDRVANVVTFGTEKSKSALQTAARGLGIDNDEALYLSSLIPADRGQTRTLNECFYGDKEKGIEPIYQFRKEMEYNYPELWEVAQNIEGLVCRCGEHAGGVIFVDEPFVNSTALMKVPNGDIVTQFDLHDCEDVSQLRLLNT